MYEVDFDSPKHVHFIGIGGISMSGLAKVLLNRGFTVSGSDNVNSIHTDSLMSDGAIVNIPQSAANITSDIDLVVYTAAIHPDNAEYKAAEDNNIPMLSRAQFLGQLMNNYKRSIAVAGTHGKTSTTSMISQILLELDEKPTISVGGVFSAIGGNIYVGDSDIFVTEACEYTNSYHEFFARYSIILNIEEDHLDFFSDLNDIRDSFAQFASNTQESGALIINNDIDDISQITRDVKSKIVTFSVSGEADVVAVDITYDDKACGSFDVIYKGERMPRITLNVPGEHNVVDALAAIATCLEFGIDYSYIQSGLNKFRGANRRFEYKGTRSGVIIYDDYAHHPTEIMTTLKMAQKLKHNRVVCVFQPHTYTRTKALLTDTANALSYADVVVLAKIFPAREEDIYNISSYDLLKVLQDMEIEAYCFDTFEEILQFVCNKCINNDLLITMGAGDIVDVANQLTEQ